eukprot:CAMPEP_0171307750 /NCGR_PEP_ID=MMETSP0816-20121228/17787_1 /TAXON_ID=420281 /ORGANISM="Proboscia inermis, Strain CCAP1064/1" /LENGTH=66 /DNA_ID=CAMNT_0011790123 /DNA_START=380 /DNA_END=577 /DNA_ORIENTATION=-
MTVLNNNKTISKSMFLQVGSPNSKWCMNHTVLVTLKQKNRTDQSRKVTNSAICTATGSAFVFYGLG